MAGRLLLVDDNRAHLEAMALVFGRSDYEVLKAGDGTEALSLLMEDSVDVVVSDIQMPGISGAELFNRLRVSDSGFMPQFILVTAYGTVEAAVELMQNGLAAYLTKPLNMKELRAQVQRCMDIQRQARKNEMLEEENRLLKAQVGRNAALDTLIGESADMIQLKDRIHMVADTRATVLIEGESGTGKELVARAIHQNSGRAAKPFIPVHCAALSETLMESELFGHEKGAFTGAVDRKPGLFELADGGTVFLDEIGDVPPSTQVKLLRVLESREFLRVGGVKNVSVDVRVIAATNKNLQEEVDEGHFREDLFYRLSVVRLDTPPLRAHSADIPLLVRKFLRQFEEEHGKGNLSVNPEVLDLLRMFHWPGNVRQLRNMVESLVLFAKNGEICVNDLPAEVRGVAQPEGNEIVVHVGDSLELVERKVLAATLKACDGNRTKTAELLGVNRRTIIRRIQELGLGN